MVAAGSVAAGRRRDVAWRLAEVFPEDLGEIVAVFVTDSAGNGGDLAVAFQEQVASLVHAEHRQVGEEAHAHREDFGQRRFFKEGSGLAIRRDHRGRIPQGDSAFKKTMRARQVYQ